MPFVIFLPPHRRRHCWLFTAEWTFTTEFVLVTRAEYRSNYSFRFPVFPRHAIPRIAIYYTLLVSLLLICLIINNKTSFNVLFFFLPKFLKYCGGRAGEEFSKRSKIRSNGKSNIIPVRSIIENIGMLLRGEKLLVVASTGYERVLSTCGHVRARVYVSVCAPLWCSPAGEPGLAGEVGQSCCVRGGVTRALLFSSLPLCHPIS